MKAAKAKVLIAHLRRMRHSELFKELESIGKNEGGKKQAEKDDRIVRLILKEISRRHKKTFFLFGPCVNGKCEK